MYPSRPTSATTKGLITNNGALQSVYAMMAIGVAHNASKVSKQMMALIALGQV